MFKRPAKLSDRIPPPYANEKEARSAQNGAYPPDLSLIAKARSVENHSPWYLHIFQMMRDIAIGYQEGGADYMHALLTGYKETPPEGVKMADGMHYNAAFPGNQIAMPSPLSAGAVTYQDGTPQTVEQYARDVTAFLAWAADPTLEQSASRWAGSCCSTCSSPRSCCISPRSGSGPTRTDGSRCRRTLRRRSPAPRAAR